MTARGWIWAGLLVAGCTRGAPPAPPAGDTLRLTHEAAPAPAAAQATADTADPCAAATSQMAINACMAGEAKRSDSLETAQYQAAVEFLKGRGQPDALKALDSAEQAWKVFVDAQCRAEAAVYDGGSAAPTAQAGCRRRQQQARIALLREVYTSP